MLLLPIGKDYPKLHVNLQGHMPAESDITETSDTLEKL